MTPEVTTAWIAVQPEMASHRLSFGLPAHTHTHTHTHTMLRPGMTFGFDAIQFFFVHAVVCGRGI